MPLFGQRRHHNTAHFDHTGPSTHNHNHHYNHGTGQPHHNHQGFGFGLFHRKNPHNVEAGYKAALANPNVTHEGREHAKHGLRQMGVNPHVPLMTKIKRSLGIRSTHRRNVNHHHHYPGHADRY